MPQIQLFPSSWQCLYSLTDQGLEVCPTPLWLPTSPSLVSLNFPFLSGKSPAITNSCSSDLNLIVLRFKNNLLPSLQFLVLVLSFGSFILRYLLPIGGQKCPSSPQCFRVVFWFGFSWKKTRRGGLGLNSPIWEVILWNIRRGRKIIECTRSSCGFRARTPGELWKNTHQSYPKRRQGSWGISHNSPSVIATNSLGFLVCPACGLSVLL